MKKRRGEQTQIKVKVGRLASHDPSIMFIRVDYLRNFRKLI